MHMCLEVLLNFTQRFLSFGGYYECLKTEAARAGLYNSFDGD